MSNLNSFIHNQSSLIFFPHTMSLTNSLRKFFDVPLIKTATNPHDIYSYLDEPSDCNFSVHSELNMSRKRQFLHSGTIPPLRPTHPNRFKVSARINPTNDSNVMVEPQTIHRSKRKNEKKTSLCKLLKDDSIAATLKIGINQKERALRLEWLNNGSHSEWRADSLMQPKDRRVLHKLDVIRKKQKLLDHQNIFRRLKQQWLVPKEYPRGVIGVDTPIFVDENDSIFYKEQIKERQMREKNQNSIAKQRKMRIHQKQNIHSGLLYHCPSTFEHKLNERELMKKKKTFKKMAFEQTHKRIFQGAED